jgi:stress-induced morphogen
MNKGEIELIIEKKIRKNFPNSNFSIKNTSIKHKKHKQNISGEETHFLIYLESYKFFNLSKLERQKYFINILGNEIINKVHSISLKLTTPNKKNI